MNFYQILNVINLNILINKLIIFAKKRNVQIDLYAVSVY